MIRRLILLPRKSAFLALLLCLSLTFSQTVVVPIPGEKPPPEGGGGSGGSGIGVVVGVLLGTALLFVLTKTLIAKGGSSPPRMLFIPFQFIALHRGPLPEGVKVLESTEVEGMSLSLLEWKEKEEELGKRLAGRVMLLQPNYLYELMGEGEVRGGALREGGGVVAVLDTGADEELLGGILAGVKNMRSEPYSPELHGTAVAYLVNRPKGAKVFLYRVCSRGRCDSWSVAKALADLIRRNIKVVNMSFGTPVQDRIVAFLIKLGKRRGITFVAPAGNRPSGRLPFPARLEEVIAVAGKPCFPEGVCLKADVREPYRFETPAGEVEGTSFSSAFFAGKLTGLRDLPRD